jgi:ABC-type multidrug transport system fused ATPase/permease subunit
LEDHPSSYNLLQRFTLYRELEHVGRNAKEVSRIAIDKVRQWTIVCLCVLNIGGAIEYLLLIVFLVYFEIYLLLGRSFREVSADQTAAYEMSKDVENDEFIRVMAELETVREYEADVAEERKETQFAYTQRYRAKHLRRIASNPSLFLEKYNGHDWVTPSTVWALFYLPLSILAAAILLDHRNAIANHWAVVTSVVAFTAISLQLITRLYFYKQGEKLHAALNLYIYRAAHPDAKGKALYVYSDKRNNDVLVGDRKFFEQCLAEGRIDSSTLIEIIRRSDLE